MRLYKLTVDSLMAFPGLLDRLIDPVDVDGQIFVISFERKRVKEIIVPLVDVSVYIAIFTVVGRAARLIIQVTSPITLPIFQIVVIQFLVKHFFLEFRYLHSRVLLYVFLFDRQRSQFRLDTLDFPPLDFN